MPPRGSLPGAGNFREKSRNTRIESHQFPARGILSLLFLTLARPTEKKGNDCMRKSRYAYTAALVAGLLAGGALIMSPRNARAEDNGIGRTPVLGWSTWSFNRKEPTAAKMEAQAPALKNSGLPELGYKYI